MKRRTVVLIPFNDLDIFINTPQSSFNRILSAFVFVDKQTLLDCLPLALNWRICLIPLYLEVSGKNIKDIFGEFVHPRKDSRIL